MNKCGLIILAAGSSSRYGAPKQLLEFNGASLIEGAVMAASDSTASPRVVVTGANAAAINPLLASYPVHVAYNPFWADGMASSIACGLTALLEIEPSIQNVLFMVCDQPFVSSFLIDIMIGQINSDEDCIIACNYEGTIGTPVIFSWKYFAGLRCLTGRGGAKKIIADHQDKVTLISFPGGAIDIDTIADYESLLSLV